ncbi:hypothetical protein ENUP19_0047G0205 [Entamoeba nuttalli]|uniref:Uncharacterized protein n=1 Tax=Entamoeba nuttalli TaxID=412467 RepID=A0ABQ0DBA7_9EUKA
MQQLIVELGSVLKEHNLSDLIREKIIGDILKLPTFQRLLMTYSFCGNVGNQFDSPNQSPRLTIGMRGLSPRRRANSSGEYEKLKNENVILRQKIEQLANAEKKVIFISVEDSIIGTKKKIEENGKEEFIEIKSGIKDFETITYNNQSYIIRIEQKDDVWVDGKTLFYSTIGKNTIVLPNNDIIDVLQLMNNQNPFIKRIQRGDIKNIKQHENENQDYYINTFTVVLINGNKNNLIDWLQQKVDTICITSNQIEHAFNELKTQLNQVIQRSNEIQKENETIKQTPQYIKDLERLTQLKKLNIDTTFEPMNFNITALEQKRIFIEDVSCVYYSFEKYLFIKYKTNNPEAVICLINDGDNEPAVVHKIKKGVDYPLTIEDTQEALMFGRGNGLKAKENDELLILDPKETTKIKCVTSPSVFDRIHIKEGVYITSVDITSYDKTKPLVLEYFSTTTTIQLKKEHSLQLYKMQLPPSLNKSGLVMCIEQVKDSDIDKFIIKTKDSFVRPHIRPKNNVFFIESSSWILKTKFADIPVLLMIPWKDDPLYKVYYFVSEGISHQVEIHI